MLLLLLNLQRAAPRAGAALAYADAGVRRRKLSAYPALDQYNLTHLHADDRLAADLIVMLVTQGFFNGTLQS